MRRFMASSAWRGAAVQSYPLGGVRGLLAGLWSSWEREGQSQTVGGAPRQGKRRKRPRTVDDQSTHPKIIAGGRTDRCAAMHQLISRFRITRSEKGDQTMQPDDLLD